MIAKSLSVALAMCCVLIGARNARGAEPAVRGNDSAKAAAGASDVAGKPGEAQPAKISVKAAGRQTVGGAAGFSLAVEVANPNQKESLTFIGYKPDSFDPPIPKGQISPIYKIELRRAGKWEAHPIGWCGTGMGAIALAPQAKATFGVWVPGGDWDVVRVGVTWTKVDFEKAGEKPGDFTTEWSNELSHKEVEKAK